ncbi:MAG: radical SAM protein [Ferroplasma sp.]
MSTVVLTSDRGTFSNYGGVSTLGYVACLPYNIVPETLMNNIFTPEAKMRHGETGIAPYALRKLEAALVHAGITGVKITPPEDMEKYIDSNTKVLGINVHDPYGLSPVTFKLTMLFGGQKSWTSIFYERLEQKVEALKEKYGFKVIVGGPAVWQLGLRRPAYVDTLFNGEAEVDFPLLAKKAIAGEKLPSDVMGRMPKVEEIPTIIKGARFGEVQVTRGCPRGCQFCSITPETYRTIPLDNVLEETRIELNAGFRDIELITDDILLYGQKKLKVNHDALVELFSGVKKLGARYITFPHISAPAVLTAPETVMAISEIAGLKEYGAEAPVVGLETGSTRIMEKYMNAKPYPWKPEDWKTVINKATPIMNEASIFPCYTMTIGFQDEKDSDVDESIDIVDSIIDNNYRAFIFPLPVIPMTSSHIHNDPFPYMEGLPSKYWELLYISWKYDFKTIREIIPVMAGQMNPLLKVLVRYMTGTIFSHLDNIFKQLSETHGESSKRFSNIDLNSAAGFLKSIMWIGKAGLETKIKERKQSAATSYKDGPI